MSAMARLSGIVGLLAVTVIAGEGVHWWASHRRATYGAAGPQPGDQNEALIVLGVPWDRIVIEAESHSTWQNIERSLPLVERADVIKVVSDPIHAARGRRYVRHIRPDLGARLVPTSDYRVLERWWLKEATVLYAAYRVTRDRLRPAGRSGPA